MSTVKESRLVLAVYPVVRRGKPSLWSSVIGICCGNVNFAVRTHEVDSAHFKKIIIMEVPADKS